LMLLPIAVTPEEIGSWNRVTQMYSPQSLYEAQRSVLHELNVVVAATLGLNEQELAFIEAELSNDSFLKRIRPRYPGTVTRKQGFRAGLNAGSRYES
jgi:hypothetical protein